MKEAVKVKITVLKRFNPSEVFKSSPVTFIEPTGACDVFSDGQEFIVENLIMPEGFCPMAWLSICNNVRLLSYGCNFPWFKEEGVTINCCIDGLRPVIFKLERIK
ncbi:MAG: TIGR04076 family protein [Candidatus Bathyarchaeota archaeon]|nr:TIGR04076 family protein [Candidatus Bathyarchaeota archaeon]